MARLVKELSAFTRKAERKGLTPVVRLNGTSDIAWERVALPAGWNKDGSPVWIGMGGSIMERFPDLQFYDYTKVTKRAMAFGRGDMPANYHVTFSLAEDNDAAAYDVLSANGSVAAVFFKIPNGMVFGANMGEVDRFQSRNSDYSIPVVDGDASDLRFLDQRGVIIGLKAKGKARKDTSGFVRAA